MRVPRYSREPAELSDPAPSAKETIVVIDERVLFGDCLVRCLRAKIENHIAGAFANVAKWQDATAHHPPAALIVFCNPGRICPDPQSTCDQSFLFLAATDVPVVIVSDAEDADQVRLAIESGARGYIPTSMELDVVVQVLHLVRAGGTFVPASSLTSFKQAQESMGTHNGDKENLFTVRQAAVAQAVGQGKANKQIAYELGIGESSVKLHLRKVMRKLNVKNRTAVAMLANSLNRGSQ